LGIDPRIKHELHELKYSFFVIPPSTGGQAGIYAVAWNRCTDNCKDAYGMTGKLLDFGFPPRRISRG
jgi:hypothetical protein